VANGAKRLLEEYDPVRDTDGVEYRSITRAVLLELLDSRRCDSHARSINMLKRFMYIMTGAWAVIAALLSAGYFFK